jgi:tight adherence protein B
VSPVPTLDALLVGLCAAGVVAGVALAVAGMVGTDEPDRPRRRGRLERQLRAAFTRGHTRTDGAERTRRQVHLIAAVVAGLLTWLWTNLPVAGLIVVVAVVGLPWLMQPGRSAQFQIERLEALEEWVRRLADIHTVGLSLEESIRSSRRNVPTPIAQEVGDLVDRLTAGVTPKLAYERFADAIDDTTGDKVAALFLLHITDRGPGLGAALQGLATSVSEEVRMRRKVEADRAKPRTNARWVTGLCLLMVGAMMLFRAEYLAPYGGVFGQLILVLLAGGFAGVLVWMRTMTNARPSARFLQACDQPGTKRRTR